MQEKSKLNKAPEAAKDPVELLIQQEVEEFLRDLTLEYPFPEIFEILRRHEFKERFGTNVMPFPQKKFSAESMKEIEGRIGMFLRELRKTFGSTYFEFIEKAFKFYTETTLEE